MRGVRAATPVAALMVLSRIATAQQVRGEIRDSATAFVIPGAVASVFDATGKPLARTVADQFGRYRLVVSESAVRLQILRIGYRPREVRLPPVRGDTVLTIDIAMSPVPKFLSAVRVSDRSICPDRETGGEALSLWEQARAGLLAMVVARTERPAQLRNLVYERAIDLRSGKITGQKVTRSSGMSHQPFVASRAPEEFVRYGYMLEDRSGRTYFAPDADVLLDPTFMAAHCFRIQLDDRGRPGDIGLAFVPAPGRDTLVDVSGVLWLDRGTLDLHMLEFRYTGLEPAASQAGSGGTLFFRLMPNGVAFIERWNILMTLLTRVLNSPHAPNPRQLRSERRDIVATGLHETGGELAAAAWPDAQWKAQLGRIVGRVRERGTGRPLTNVRVSLDGTSDVVFTDSAGAFAIDELLPGPYVLRAADSVLAEFEMSQSRTITVDVNRERPLEVALEWRTVGDVIRDLCREERGPPGAAILGRTTAADGWPTWDVPIAAAWPSDFQINADGSLSFARVARSHRSNGKGVFYLCNVPREQRIGVRATFGPQVVKDTTTLIGRDEVFTILRIARPSPRPH